MNIRRVTLVSEHASPLADLGGPDAGGQNVHVAALATELGRLGVEVTVATRRDDAAVPRFVRLTDEVVVDHITAGPACPISKDDLFAHMGAFAVELQRRWLADPPDLVHAHYWMSGDATLAAARPLGIPTAQTFHALGVVKRRHQGTDDTSPRERIAVEAQLVARADRIIATCRDEVAELRAIGAPRAVSVIPCGVDTELFTPAGPIEPRPRTLAHRVVVIGRVIERKGIGDLIGALPDVPDVELVVAGGPAASGLTDDAEVERLRRLAGMVGVLDRVRFVGAVDHDRLPALIRSADVVACVPWYEPFGIVPLEAMACGVPVLGSAVGGLLDTVVDGVTGWHVPARDPLAIARALRGALADRAGRRRMGAAGVRRARQRYRWSAVAQRTLEAYERTVAEPASELSLTSGELVR